MSNKKLSIHNFKEVVTSRKICDIISAEYSTVGKVGFMYRQSNTIVISAGTEVRV